ncbi:MAG: spermidine synthase, partial [Acidimicrobiales bacterium]
MSALFEELDRQPTPIGEISLRRRLEPVLQVEIYEAKLDDEFLMSSLFTASEVALASLALSEVAGDDLDVVVGGLGLGYTARAVLEDPRVRSVAVVEALAAVIGWHDHQLLPDAAALTTDPRCRFVEGDFFAMVARSEGFGPPVPPRVHVIAVDIDHSSRHLLDPSHASFYEPSGLARVADLLHPGGVFALWSDDPPDEELIAAADRAFEACVAHVVSFPNPHTGDESACTVYVCRRG